MKLHTSEEWFRSRVDGEAGLEIGAGCQQEPCSLSFDPTDPEILWILGRPCFVCGPIAHILQAAGHPIKTQAEDEQAHVIVWMIRKYQEHGADWRARADNELSALKRAAIERKLSGAND